MSIRNLIIIFIATFTLYGCASMQPLTDADRTFSRVVEAPGYTKDQIYQATKVWIAENFRSAKSVIELDSEKDGVIIGNGVIKYPCSGISCIAKNDWNVPFTMRVDMKDQKFRISFSNIRLTWPASYSNGIASAAHDGPVSTQGDMNAIKPILLNFGDEILSSMSTNKSKSNW